MRAEPGSGRGRGELGGEGAGARAEGDAGAERMARGSGGADACGRGSGSGGARERSFGRGCGAAERSGGWGLGGRISVKRADVIRRAAKRPGQLTPRSLFIDSSSAGVNGY